MNRMFRFACLVVLLGVTFPLNPQIPKTTPPGLEPEHQDEVQDPFSKKKSQPDPHLQEMRDRQLRELNRKRQAELKRDSDRLLQLATELKLYVDKSNEHVLSLEVIKKTEEIEKLARSVREKMKAENMPVAGR